MNIYYFDPSLNCSLFFISLPLYPITLYLSLAFSVFTHYPLTHFLILSHSFFFPPVCPFPSLILPSVSLHFFIFNFFFTLRSHAPLTSPLTTLHTSTVKTKESSSKLELDCLYSVPSQVSNAFWKYHNRKQNMSSKGPGSVTTTVPLPITSDTAGNYTCTLTLKNGQTIVATHAVTLPPEDGWNGMVSVFWFSSSIVYYVACTWVQADLLSTNCR